MKTTERISSNLLSLSGEKIHKSIENKRKLAQFSRNQELQADSIALEMLKQAGYDPFSLPRFLQSMAAYSLFRNIPGSQNAPLGFLITHPTTPQRIRLAIEKAHKISSANTGNTDRDAFLKSIDGMIFGGSPHTGFVQNNQFIHPQLGITFSVPQNFIIENSAHTVWASGPDKIAIRFDTIPHPAEISASEYLQSGWLAGLDKSSVHPFIIQGLPGAHARARNAQWQFDVVVILFNNHVLRFLTAAPHDSQNFAEIAEKTVQSFRFLSSSQLKKLKPLRIRIVRVQKGESVASLTKKCKIYRTTKNSFAFLIRSHQAKLYRQEQPLKLSHSKKQKDSLFHYFLHIEAYAKQPPLHFENCTLTRNCRATLPVHCLKNLYGLHINKYLVN